MGVADEGRRDVARMILHGGVGTSVIDAFDPHGRPSRRIAPRAEQAAVRADRVWGRANDRLLQRCVKEAGDAHRSS